MYDQLVKANKMKMVDKIAAFDPQLVREFTISEGDDNMPGAEYRRLKMLYKKILTLEKEQDINNKQIERERNEKALIDQNESLRK